MLDFGRGLQQMVIFEVDESSDRGMALRYTVGEAMRYVNTQRRYMIDVSIAMTEVDECYPVCS